MPSALRKISEAEYLASESDCRRPDPNLVCSPSFGQLRANGQARHPRS
ncbi:hypothetical protein [Deinococcus piscis]|nr:hypothetical protein [Deinococcus piscis]